MTLLEWPPPYQIKRHRRARSVKLRAEARQGLVITVPYRFNLRELASILDENKSWIEQQLQKIRLQTVDMLPSDIVFHSINTTYKITYEHLDTRLRLWQRSENDMVVLGNMADQQRCKKLLSMWVRKLSKEYLPKHFHRLSQLMGIEYQGLTIRNQKTVWGSCTSQHTINLNYKLFLLPIHLMNYVMVHELCHTKHLNHSDQFWRLVERYDPNWKQHRQALRTADKYIPGWIC